MGISNGIAFQDKLSDPPQINPLYPIGTVRWETDDNGVMGKYEYVQVDDAVLLGQFVANDIAASTDCNKVTPSGTVGQKIRGVALSDITDEYYTWIQTGGHMTGFIEDGTAAGDALTGSASAGSLATTTGAAAENFDGFTAVTANASGVPALREVYRNL